MTVVSRQLSDYLLSVKNINPVVEFGGSDFTYVDISSVDRESHTISKSQVVAADSAPSRARQLLSEDDVLVSTVRPNLNTVAKVSDFHRGAIASTGFCVLRPNPELLDASYLFHWITSDSTVTRLVSLATGATYPAVSDRTIKSQQIDLPPLSEQRRIATILDKAQSLRRKRQESIQIADAFLRAVFIKMFGNRPKTKVLTDYCEFLAGFAFKSDQYTTPESAVRLLRGVNVGIGRFEWTDTASYPLLATSGLDRYLLIAGDVVLAMDRPWISSGLKCAIVDETVAGSMLVQRVARLRPKLLENQTFIFHCLKGHDFKSHCRITETTIPHISPTDFSTFPVVDARDCELELFAKIAENVRRIASKSAVTSELAVRLQMALQHKFINTKY